MMDDNHLGQSVRIGDEAIHVSLTYADGSRIQMSMPKPPGLDALAPDQAELMARRMGGRLLAAAQEDLTPRA